MAEVNFEPNSTDYKHSQGGACAEIPLDMALRQVSFADIALQYVDLMDAKEYPTKSPELAHRRSLIRSNTVADGGDNGEAAQAAEATAQQQQQALAVRRPELGFIFPSRYLSSYDSSLAILEF